ncbi:MAG TPA: hypothetical protein VNS32_26185, partial [Flavisolibacter sp.]|nr:hypothetical protein [Flavisolibacter sp.]
MKKLIWLFCFLSFTINCFPQPGRLDSSFGNKGIQLTSFFKGNAGSELPINTFLQSDGKILVAFMSAARAMIVRYLQDGSLDLSYGNQGFSLSADIEMVNAVLLSDGKTLLIGQNLQTKKVVLVRYTNNGFIDSTFGKNGVVNTDPRSNLFAISGAVQEDGKIVVGGYVSSTLAVARFNSNGTLDNSFNGSGMSVPNPDVNGAIYEIAVQKDGKILAAGTANEAFALVRYNLD